MSEREPNLEVGVTIRDAGTAVLALAGELDMESAHLLQDELSEQLRQKRAHLVLDLSALGFMDSSGLNVLIRTVHQARALGGDVHLAAPTSAVRRILEITGVTTTIPPHADLADALAAAGAAR